MEYIRPKKSLGQHFLQDVNIARKIVDSLSGHGEYSGILELGPGTGVLTQFLLQKEEFNFCVIEIDRESTESLNRNYPGLNILSGDFLKFDYSLITEDRFALIGNFPYNISSQIMFRVIDQRDRIPEVVGMFQKEVAKRIACPPGSKQYGILSVLLQTWYDIEYLFEVPPQVFFPPPKVDSAVVRFKRNETKKLDCDELRYTAVVKAGFNQSRKTLRNALKMLGTPIADTTDPIFDRRAETLSVEEFVRLTNMLG